MTRRAPNPSSAATAQPPINPIAPQTRPAKLTGMPGTKSRGIGENALIRVPQQDERLGDRCGGAEVELLRQQRFVTRDRAAHRDAAVAQKIVG